MHGESWQPLFTHILFPVCVAGVLGPDSGCGIAGRMFYTGPHLTNQGAEHVH